MNRELWKWAVIFIPSKLILVLIILESYKKRNPTRESFVSLRELTHNTKILRDLLIKYKNVGITLID